MEFTEEEKQTLHPYVTELLVDFGLSGDLTDEFLQGLDKAEFLQGSINFHMMIDMVETPSWLDLGHSLVRDSLNQLMDYYLAGGVGDYWNQRLLKIYYREFPSNSLLPKEIQA